MGTKPAGEENVRKLQKTGEDRASYMVTLPKEYIKKLGWREHQKVVVTLDGKEIRIRDWKE